MAGDILNANNFGHTCNNGTMFTCTRCDFKEPVIVAKPKGIREEDFIADCIEMAGWHAVNIWPRLNGFSGYDAVEYKIIEDEE